MKIGRAVAVRVIGVTFHLCRTAFIGLHHQRHRARSRGSSRGKKLRHAVHITGRLFTKGDDRFHRPPTAYAKHPHTRQAGGGTHELEKIAPRKIFRQLHRALGKFLVAPIRMIRRVIGFANTAPVLDF